jgi:hypothetical protein
MEPNVRRGPLAAADAAARRLLTQAIDIRFNLEDAREQIDGGDAPSRAELQRLRDLLFDLQNEIDHLEAVLYPLHSDSDFSLEEEADTVIF